MYLHYLQITTLYIHPYAYSLPYLHTTILYCKPSRLGDILGKRFWVLGESPPL
eukprot:COSAG02_NODE_1251_length_13599_cov_13.573259_1_plen_52_part_10